MDRAPLPKNERRTIGAGVTQINSRVGEQEGSPPILLFVSRYGRDIATISAGKFAAPTATAMYCLPFTM